MEVYTVGGGWKLPGKCAETLWIVCEIEDHSPSGLGALAAVASWMWEGCGGAAGMELGEEEESEGWPLRPLPALSTTSFPPGLPSSLCTYCIYCMPASSCFARQLALFLASITAIFPYHTPIHMQYTSQPNCPEADCESRQNQGEKPACLGCYIRASKPHTPRGCP